MTENFATDLAIREDATGPAGLIAGPYRVNAVSALLQREMLTGTERRDVWRAITHRVVALSGHSLGWEFDVGDADTLELVIDSLADPGRATDLAGVRTWPMGRPTSVRRFDFIIDPVEGGHFELLRAACVSAQIGIERGRVATCLTRWAGQDLSTADTATEPDDLYSVEFANAATCTIDVEGVTGKVFAGAIAFDRDIQPAGYRETGGATGWKGSGTVDVLGRIACRLDTDDFADLMIGTILDREIIITMQAGARARTITLPSCRIMLAQRTFIGEGTYEHQFEFAVVRSEDQDVAVFTSEDTL